MDDHRNISIAVYSSIVTPMAPEIFLVEATATARSLMVLYLQKHKLELIDPNLITVWRIKSSDASEFTFKIPDSLSNKLNKDDLVITPSQLFGEEFYHYYLSFERGIQVKVTVNVDKSRPSCQVLLISTIATANLLIKLLHDHMPITKQSRLNLRHKTGILKGNENLVSLIRNSKSDEFFIDLNRSLQYDKTSKNDILKRIKTEYDRRKSDSTENKNEKLDSNLSKTVYHSNQPNHRKLPDLVGVTYDEQSDNIFQHGYINSSNKDLEDRCRQEIHRRSLPLIPPSSQTSSRSQNNYSTYDPSIQTEKKFLTNKDYPPEPILRTNLLNSDNSQSSTASMISVSDNNSVKEENTFQESVITKSAVNTILQFFPNLFQIVEHCDLHSIHVPVNSTDISPRHIEFTEQLFKDVIKEIENKPQGPNPVLGSEKSAFKTIESSKETVKCIVLLVENHNIDINACNISKGDILVDIDGENVISKSRDYINLKLSKNCKHNLVIARLRSESNNNREKDKKINKLKNELEILKRKYSDLHHVTVDNDKIIQQLTKVLKNQEISNNSGVVILKNN